MKYLVILLFLSVVGCGDSNTTDNRVINRNNEYNDYNITDIKMLCNEMNDGDVYRLSEDHTGSIIRNNGDCVLRFDDLEQ